MREFLDCRDLVEDAFFHCINPAMVVAEEPRKSFPPGIALLFLWLKLLILFYLLSILKFFVL